METTIVYWGYIEIMEKKMETTIMENTIDCRGTGGVEIFLHRSRRSGQAKGRKADPSTSKRVKLQLQPKA